MSDERTASTLPDCPHAALREALRLVIAQLEDAGQGGIAQRLNDALEEWWREQADWTGAIARQLTVHHDINNALVGVRGNAQLLMMGPAALAPGVRERLDVMLRESERIREAAQRLNALKSTLTAVVRDSESKRPSRAA